MKSKSIKLIDLLTILIIILFIFFITGKALFSKDKAFSSIAAKIVNVDAEQNSYDVIKPNELGDINDDGSITVEDVLLIQKYLVELITFTDDQKLRADTNKDGIVDINDATYLQRYIELLNPYDRIGANGLGDINDDGNITVEDATLIQKFLADIITFTDDQKLRADTNKDGSVDISDVTFLQRYIMTQNPYDVIKPNGLGDINDDGNITVEDATLIQKYLVELITFTDDQKLRADTNKDGSIDINDVSFLQKYIVAQNMYDKIEPNGLGDIDDDGIIDGDDTTLIQEYLVELITFIDDQKLRADTNKDGNIDINDVTFLQRYIIAQNPYDEIKPNGLGDINDDGVIEGDDATLIQEFLAGITNFTGDQKLRADTNKDGEVSIDDVTFLQRYIVSQNPYDGIGANQLGDINNDSYVNGNDIRLIQEFLVGITTLADDQKLRADTNQDGRIDINDVTFLQRYIKSQNPYNQIQPNGLGDMDDDGSITSNDARLIQEFLAGITTFTDDQKLRADTNRDGDIDINDVTYLQRYIITQNPYDEIKPNGLGDIDDDGSITSNDAKLIQEFLAEIITFTDDQKLRADTNSDGDIDINDVTYLQKYIIAQNPYDEIKPNGLGDANDDGIINSEDITLIQQYVIGKATFTADQKLRADTNKNGSVNISDVTFLQKYINADDEGPYITSITQTPTNWTNNSVTLIVQAIDYRDSEIEYSFDGGETWQSSNEYEVESNGTIEIKVRNSNGNTDSKPYEVINIDKVAPVVSISNDGGEGTIIILANDEDGSGVASVRVNGATLDQREGYTDQWIFVPEQNGTYTITVTDYAGNTISMKKVVNYIDNDNNDNNNSNNDNNNNNNANNNNGSGLNSNGTSNSNTADISTSRSVLPYAGRFWDKIIVALIAVFGVIGITEYMLLKKYKNI
ncbi:MAG: dockerin type I domain-containing protein [Clostridia bacterium]